MTSSEPPPTKKRHRKPKRARSRATIWRRRVVAALVSLVVLAALVVGAGYGYVQWRFHQIHRENVSGLAAITGTKTSHGQVSAARAPYTILLVGDNCRDCLDGTQAGAFGSASDVGGGRSDVTMLLHVDPVTGRVAILSIPRDLWLPIPNSSAEIRVDAALNNGASALVNTIEDALDIPINHYVELNFDTFQKVVNALGGVNMQFPAPLYDSYSGLNVPAGCFHLNGTQALAVVRARHTYYQQNGVWQYDGLGDISRIQRDHEFLRILAAAVASQGLGNPVVDNNLISSVVKDITIDNTFGLNDLAQLAQIFSHVNIGDAPQTTLPVDEDNSPDGFVYRGQQYGDVVFPSNAGDHAAIRSFLDGTQPDSSGRPTLPVTVTNGSGIPEQATTTADKLRALGYPIAAESTGTIDSNPAESVVYYAPGHEQQAQQLADELGGAVALGQDATIAGAGLTLITGTNLTVAAAPAAAPAHSQSASPTPGAATATTSVPVKTAAPATQPAPSATPIGGLTQLSPTYPSFDPTSCAPGAHASALPNLPTPDLNGA